MSEQYACGKGLAGRSTLPAKLAEITCGLADILAFHQRSLELADDHATTEFRAYVRLEEQYRTITSSLSATARTMAEARDLPAARHDGKTLASSENAAIFKRFVDLEQELLALLETAIKQDRAMLTQMGRTKN